MRFRRLIFLGLPMMLRGRWVLAGGEQGTFQLRLDHVQGWKLYELEPSSGAGCLIAKGAKDETRPLSLLISITRKR
jgi:hypothetical protein